MLNKITSTANQKVKFAFQIQNSNQKRKKEGLFCVEGDKEVSFMLDAHFKLKEVYIYRTLFDNSALEERIILLVGNENVFEISKEVYDKLAYRENVNGIIALAYEQHNRLENINLSEKPFIIVLDGIEKPGNVGAILRTADAANIDAVILCENTTDLYNPNVIRSSVGCVFSCHVVHSDKNEVIDWLVKNNIAIFATSLDAQVLYTEVDFNQPLALVMGSEDKGVSEDWLKVADISAKIPMLGKNDSLNVSVSTAIFVFEVLRQRDN